MAVMAMVTVPALVLMAFSVLPVMPADPRNCSHKIVGERIHYFDHYDEVTYNVSCADLCLLPLPADLHTVSQVKVYFPVNNVSISGQEVVPINCSWITPTDLGGANRSLVMFFEPFKPVSLAYEVPCRRESDGNPNPNPSPNPSLWLWDEHSGNGNNINNVPPSSDPNTFTICRDPAKSGRAEDYHRWSSRLGGQPNALLSLTDFPVREGWEWNTNPVLLKYVLVDWDEDCHSGPGYKELDVWEVDQFSVENTTSPGNQWFTSDLRLPSELRCKWRLSSSSSDLLIRLRISVLGRTSITGQCRRDDTVVVEDGGGGGSGAAQRETFTLCDDSVGPFFFLGSPGSSSLTVDFTSGPHSGAPEWKMSYSALPACPSPERLLVETDLEVNAVYGVVGGGAGGSGSSRLCRWTLHTNWTYNVVMITGLDVQPPLRQQDCNDPGKNSLTLTLGSVVRTVSLCQPLAPTYTTATSFTNSNSSHHMHPLPMWSQGLDVNVDLNVVASASATRKVSVFYKSVPKVANCQGHPGMLEAVFNEDRDLNVDVSLQRTLRHVSAPDCRWLVYAAPQQSSAKVTEDQQQRPHVAEVTLAGYGILWQANLTTAGWFITGFRAYAGDAVNASARLKENCFYDSHTLQCQYISTEPSLLLVYNPDLSSSPVPVGKFSLSVRMVEDPRASSAPRLRCWPALYLWLSLVVVARVVLTGGSGV